MSGTMDHIFPASSAIAAGAIIESALGFGCNLIWMAFFPLFTTVKESVGVHQPLAIALNTLILARTYRHATPAEFGPLVFTVPLGIFAGVWVVTSWPVRLINFLLGMFLLVYTFLHRNSDPEESSSDEQDPGPTPRKDHTAELDDNIEMEPLSTENPSPDQQKMYLRYSSSAEEEQDSDTSSTVNPSSEFNGSVNIQHLNTGASLAKQTLHPSLKNEDADNKEECISSIEEEESLSTGPCTVMKKIFHGQSLTSVGAGFFGGALTSAFGTGGPAILIYAKEIGWDSRHPDTFRANMQLIFFLMHILAISSMVASKVITIETVKASAMLSPSLVIGGVIGGKVASEMPKEIFRKLVMNGLRVIGSVFIGKALVGKTA